ncbi:unnamed protein product [Protopolystoma xenopodis]|uniref:Immunoglobulin I-set domain-containing protein n=1 Tax=Protopolystoma xenopodis TaxID=117903 RepID=A0A3S5CCK8_9PLAT|nr:unnamed protein product [Protopolystoma xenopodis]
MIPCSDDVRHMTDESLAPFHRGNNVTKNVPIKPIDAIVFWWSRPSNFFTKHFHSKWKREPGTMCVQLGHPGRTTRLRKPKIRPSSRWLEPTEWDRGDTLQLKLPFTGYPKPTAVFSLNGQPLREGRGVSIQMKERHAILTIDSLAAEHSGRLTVRMENEMGTDSVDIQLQVNDRPPPPINVTVEGVTDGAATLSWKMPPGTKYISEYVIERCEVPGDHWIRVGTFRLVKDIYACEESDWAIPITLLFFCSVCHDNDADWVFSKR